MLGKIIKAIIAAVLEHFKELRLERDYQEALLENERFNERQRKAEAAQRTTKAVLNETTASPDDIAAVKRRLHERAQRNASASK